MGEAETKKQNKTLLTWKGRNKKSSFKKNDFQATSICRSFLFRDFSSFHSFLKSKLQYHKIHPFGEQSKEGVENLRGCFGTLSSPPPQVSQCPRVLRPSPHSSPRQHALHSVAFSRNFTWLQSCDVLSSVAGTYSGLHFF